MNGKFSADGPSMYLCVPHFGSLLRVRARVLGNVPYGSSLTCKLTRESFEYLAVKVNHKLLLSSFKNQSDISGFFQIS